ncbi:MAG: hypothetical protein K9W44_03470 [Candidatus Lokiarchaeota archaeon]|nr:hypothetical protein [Candidatus Harpocratesius repetitus]
MDVNSIIPEFDAFIAEFPDFDLFIILTQDGIIKYCSDPDRVQSEQTKALMQAWLNHESACVLGKDRYPILSWEPLQFAARNVKGKGALVGTVTSSNHYLVAHLKPDAKLAPAIAAIYLNRKFWKLI